MCGVSGEPGSDNCCICYDCAAKKDLNRMHCLFGAVIGWGIVPRERRTDI